MQVDKNSMDNLLEKEALLFTRYLLDSDPPGEMIDRYISANRRLGVRTVTAADDRILNFSVAHPWSIPFLDAAAGFVQPEAVLRKKIYAMAAVLEASPRYTEHFLPESLSPVAFVCRLAANGLKAGAKVIIGIPMLMLIRNRSND